jgi:hypothetical protein
MILVFARACYLAILTLNQVLWLLVVEFYRITYSPPPSRCFHVRPKRMTPWLAPVAGVARKCCSSTVDDPAILFLPT